MTEREKAKFFRSLSKELDMDQRDNIIQVDEAYRQLVNDPKLGKGVRIWRTAPKTAAATSPATAGDSKGTASA